jgi:hypothetical protein
MKRTAEPVPELPRVRAYLSWALPVLGWVLRALVSLFLDKTLIDAHCFFVMVEMMIVLAGLIIGITVLVHPGGSSRGIQRQAVAGVVLSAVTIFYNCLPLGAFYEQW